MEGRPLRLRSSAGESKVTDLQVAVCRGNSTGLKLSRVRLVEALWGFAQAFRKRKFFCYERRIDSRDPARPEGNA
jgi:hypothetical protein